MSWEIVGNNLPKSKCFQVHLVSMLWSFGFSLLIWGKMHRFLWIWWVISLKSRTSTGYVSNSTGSSVTSSHFSPLIGTEYWNYLNLGLMNWLKVRVTQALRYLPILSIRLPAQIFQALQDHHAILEKIPWARKSWRRWIWALEGPDVVLLAIFLDT